MITERILLSGIEIRFLKHICQDKTYIEISKEMGKSPRTIDGYRDILFSKLKVKTRTGLVLYAIKHQYVIVNNLNK